MLEELGNYSNNDINISCCLYDERDTQKSVPQIIKNIKIYIHN